MAILITGRFWSAQFEFWAHRRLALAAGLRVENGGVAPEYLLHRSCIQAGE